MTINLLNLSQFLLVLAGLFATVQAGLAAAFKFGDQTITVPDGFVVEKVAASPLTDRPITSDFDELGRLYVAESSGANDSVETQLAEKPHSILRLEDSDGDGLFDKRTVYADKMMFPAGTMWHDGSLYVTAPPEIWKLTDTDDDGVADKREVWYDPGTLTGCANDLHGPYLGLDGWIYWTKGAFAEQLHELTTGEPFVTRAAHIFRMHPDGGGVESVMTGGMDNPVELAFTPGGERIFSATFLQHPGGGNRDGLIHATYGGTYGKVNGVVDDHPRTGELLPPMTHLGPAAACALMRYESGAFGEVYRDNLFSSSFNLAKVTRHELIPEGSTFHTVDTDFMVSDSADFHPTHIEEDADGSLLVIDTGGWYKLCCPTSQLHKPDVLGGIYRIRKEGAPVVKDPRGVKLNWQAMGLKELVNRLEDARFAVQKRAINELVSDGVSSVPVLREVLVSSEIDSKKLSAIWALTRIDHPTARAAVRLALTDANETVRQAALHSIALWRDRPAMTELLSIVQDGTAANRRVAAEALGRLMDASAVPALLASLEKEVDRVLEHSLTYALIEINNAVAVRDGLSSRNPQVLRASLIALDQMTDRDLRATEVIPYLESDDPILVDTANWIVSRHDDWGGELAQYLSSLMKQSLSLEARRDVTAMLERLIDDKAIQNVIAESLLSDVSKSRVMCLQVIGDSQLKETPGSWANAFSKLLEPGHPDLQYTVEALRTIPALVEESVDLQQKLLTLSRDTNLSDQLRLVAIDVVAGVGLRLNDEQVSFLGTLLENGKNLSLRSRTAGSLAEANLTTQQLMLATHFVQVAGPMELGQLLTAFGKSDDAALGLRLVQSIQVARSFQSLKAETLETVFENYPASVQSEAESLLDSLRAGSLEQAAHVERVLASLPEGDIRRGQTVFNNPAIACSACHAIGYLGGESGPDLTTIGTIRTERDLLEAILYPSASFVRSYEPYQVTTKSGAVYSGILREETAEAVELLMGIDTPIRIQQSDIEEMSPGTVSLMPPGLTTSLSEQELADLIAFLKATKWR